MGTTVILMLHAVLPSTDHKFVELFTTQEKLDEYLTNNPDVQKTEVTMHELDSTSARSAKHFMEPVTHATNS
jgi:hypothetical protein